MRTWTNHWKWKSRGDMGFWRFQRRRWNRLADKAANYAMDKTNLFRTWPINLQRLIALINNLDLFEVCAGSGGVCRSSNNSTVAMPYLRASFDGGYRISEQQSAVGYAIVLRWREVEMPLMVRGQCIRPIGSATPESAAAFNLVIELTDLAITIFTRHMSD